jgi:hypothetical protein
MVHRIGRKQICYRAIAIGITVAGLAMIGLGIGIGLPAVIIGGVFVFATGSIALLFRSFG